MYRQVRGLKLPYLYLEHNIFSNYLYLNTYNIETDLLTFFNMLMFNCFILP